MNSLKSSRDPSYPNLPTHTLAMLEKIFPQKHPEVGAERLRTLVPDGVRRVGEYGIVTRHGQLLFLGLMFMFGSGFDTDPQLPDLANVLTEPDLIPQVKVEKLHQLVLDYVEKWVTWTTAEPSNG